MKKTLTLLILFFACISMYGQTSLEGKVMDKSNNEPVLFGTVALYKNGTLISGAETDFNGNYNFSNLDPGTYDVEFRYIGLQTQMITGVLAKANQINKLDVEMEEEGVLMDEIVIVEYKAPLIDFDNTTQGGTVTREKIETLPTRNINAIAATTAGIASVDEGDVSVRGSRTNATDYYIDGIRVSTDNINALVPNTEIDQMQVITGGIEARYGDVTGGIISITTRGPSARYSGGLELETSEFLDGYGFNVANGSFSGPLLKDKNGESILGFRLSGQYSKIKDPDPSAVGVYRAKEDVIRNLEENPTFAIGTTILPNAENLTNDDVELLKAAPNEGTEDYTINGKIDARVGTVDLSLSGSYFDSRDQFTPGASTVGQNNTLLNWTNNPFNNRQGYRANLRIRQKIGAQGPVGKDEEDPSIIRNMTYTLQGGYEKSNTNRDDINHGDNLFRYGYHGNQSRTWVPVASVVTDTATWMGDAVSVGPFLFDHQEYLEEDGEYIPDLNVNPALARYNPINGLLDDPLSSAWDLYANVGRPYNLSLKSESERIIASGSLSFDLLPGGSEKGKHSIQFGLNYEQRVNRQWNINPRALWTLMRLNTNRHITGVDPTNIIGSFDDPNLGATFNQYQTLIQPEDFPDAKFFREIRNQLGVSLNDYVNTDGLNPDDLSLDMFSASELINFSPVGLDYFGYDYLGNKIDNSVTFNDFFTVNADGSRNFSVGPQQPIYGAAYLQDRFKYKDIIVRLGVRVDYFDANTQVLKDPYSLYRIQDASDFYTNQGTEMPGAVQDDYKVYVASEGSDNVVGFRKGDQWFDANGTSVSGGNVLFGGGLVFPAYSDPEESRRIQEPGFDPSISFEDYEPQINVMPRVAFSFPISESAGFFAHYDILVSRPTSNTNATALDYFFFENPQRFGTANVPANNSDLKPEKTIDYEVGFQQKISNNSAVKFSAYYKELRDLIQRRFYTNIPAPLNTYQTFGNLDFGTIKGFSFTYDMRRTGNIEFTAAYTLQIANGTGSDANSSSGLNERGIIRELFALSNDERHRLSTTIDYRFGSGKKYNGPRIGGVNIFEKTGANLLLTAVSGRPYTEYITAQSPRNSSGLLTINEARLPWLFNADLRVNRNFSVKVSEESKNALNFNVWFRVSNLFDTKNIVGVFGATGDPDDDGFLRNSFGQDRLEQIDVARQDNYISAYTWRILSPGFYTRPRRMYVGLSFNF